MVTNSSSVPYKNPTVETIFNQIKAINFIIIYICKINVNNILPFIK